MVDDEERIRSSLRGLLSDEGYHVLATGDAQAAIAMIARENPALVLLDVWMPGLDGIELLRRIKHARPATPVIMISGHANIQNAVAATRLGAADFIEKPFSVSGLLAAIERVLAGQTDASRVAAATGLTIAEAGRNRLEQAGTRPQRTVAQSLVIGGQGLHSGLKTGVILHPAPPGGGIIFSSLADQSSIAARIENVTETGYNTTLSGDGHSIRTIEHLMSALHGLGVTNVLIKTDDELPALDGSAAEFCSQLRTAGLCDQAASVEPVRVGAPIQVGEGDEFIRLAPAERMIIDYPLDYPAPIGIQQ
ncbi:MAG: UDP-3-O-acyl-N-acetylglucosamine deacetylase, partial [Candidatus Binataceae bacterium]